jgi:uncharacterized membrane protein YkoI
MGAGAWVRSIGLAVVVTAATAMLARADSDEGRENGRRHEAAERASRGAESGELMPLASILAFVRGKFQGEIVATEFEMRDGRPYYEIHQLADDGRLTEVKVDDGSGRILGNETEED